MPHLYTSHPEHKDKIQEKNGKATDKEAGKKTNEKETTAPLSPQYSPSYDFPDRLSHHYQMEKDRNERFQFLNEKYNLDLK